MNELSVTRTLVKSPPELWAELSDPESLARHLDGLGEITITRIEPERTVAWEGERARGTVALEPAGWGTRVTLAARRAGAEEESPPVDDAPAEDDPEEEPTAEDIPPAAPAALRAGPLARLLGRFRRPAPEPARPSAPPPVEAAPEIEPEPGDAGLVAVLWGALDALGSAHHRPFSRG
jgi:hypothetical protein